MKTENKIDVFMKTENKIDVVETLLQDLQVDSQVKRYAKGKDPESLMEVVANDYISMMEALKPVFGKVPKDSLAEVRCFNFVQEIHAECKKVVAFNESEADNAKRENFEFRRCVNMLERLNDFQGLCEEFGLEDSLTYFEESKSEHPYVREILINPCDDGLTGNQLKLVALGQPDSLDFRSVNTDFFHFVKNVDEDPASFNLLKRFPNLDHQRQILKEISDCYAGVDYAKRPDLFGVDEYKAAKSLWQTADLMSKFMEGDLQSVKVPTVAQELENKFRLSDLASDTADRFPDYDYGNALHHLSEMHTELSSRVNSKKSKTKSDGKKDVEI